MKRTRIVFAGGFLGAGKTTLLWEAARRLINKGVRTGLITNDQAPGLVDTALLQRQGLKVAEVCGSCFCCNFGGLTDAIGSIGAEVEADVIIAEPVGSCTDLSATILQPLKQYMSRELAVAPFSALADPERLESVLRGDTAGLHADAAYIFRKQLEESDIIVVAKSDTLDAGALASLLERTREAFPASTVMAVSAVSGHGVDEWTDLVLKRTDAGRRIVQVDYDVYAHGEAVLGWLNATVQLKGKAADWDAFTRDFLSQLAQRFDGKKYAVGHVKAILEHEDRYIVGNLTGRAHTLSLRNSAGTGDTARLTVNARVETSPETLDALVRETLADATRDRCESTPLAWRCLQPGRPNPTHRFTQVVGA
ncbi:MAG: cobalamin synthesis protein P47K [Tannerella sp.]|jgi:G3E family GTPase|nr:cobalamin synthesis protein P47K [Tannerella sp.]